MSLMFETEIIFSFHAACVIYHCFNVLAKIDEIENQFETFLRGKNVLFTWQCQIREFHAHAMERGEVLKRYCG